MAGFETIPVVDANDVAQDVLFYRDDNNRLVPVTRLEGATLEVPQLVIKEPLSGTGGTVQMFTETMQGFGITNDGSSDLQFFIGPPINPSGTGLPADEADWEQGGLNASDGQPATVDNNVRIRTPFRTLDAPITVQWDGDMRMFVHAYDSGQTWIAHLTPGGAVSPFTVSVPASTAYVRFVLRADGVISPSVVPGLNILGAPAQGVTVKPGEVFEGNFAPFRSATVASDGPWRAYGLGEAS